MQLDKAVKGRPSNKLVRLREREAVYHTRQLLVGHQQGPLQDVVPQEDLEIKVLRIF